MRTTARLKDGDTIRIDIGQFLRCNFSERIIEEERNIIRTLEVSESHPPFSAMAKSGSREFRSASRAANWFA